MTRSAKDMLEEFEAGWKHYILQSLAATAVIFILLLSLSIRQEAVIIASIGATSFIIFAMPNTLTAQARNVVGGHLVGLGCGLVSAVIVKYFAIEFSVFYSFVYAVSVGLSIFIMVVIDVEHPPAAGTALGVAIRGFSWKVVIAVVAGAVILSLIHRLFRGCLRDLT